MTSIWHLANISQLDFAASATLLALAARKQSVSAPEQPDIECSDGSDSEYEEDEGEEEFATSRPTARLTEIPRDALIDKFLNRLSEVFSREKSSPQSKGRQDSKHITAAAWIKPNDESSLTIIYAKNEGPDDRDRQMSSRLQSWLRAIAASGRTPPMRTDKIWSGDLGLVDYTRRRLWYHISQINQQSQLMDALAERSGIYGSIVICLQCLCGNATVDSTVQQLSDIVNVAHMLRFVWHEFKEDVKHTKVLKSINMLRRLRAAYECFTSTALTFEEMSAVEVTPACLPHTEEIDTTRFRKRLRELAGQLRLPKGLLKTSDAQSYMGTSKLHIHAEMQILVGLAKDSDWFRRSHRYIGTSKKLCFLCNEILHNYSAISLEGPRRQTFKARESHRKVYPLWTLPQSTVAPCVASLAMATAMRRAHDEIKRELQCGPTLQPAIAESSAGATDIASITGVPTVAKQYVADQRSSYFSERRDSLEPPVTLGRKVKSVKVGLLPADGSAPRLTQISFFRLPEKPDHRIQESGFDLVPSFHDSWGQDQFDRRFTHLEVRCQDLKETEGDYRLYWNENHELPENKNIKRLLSIETVDGFRRFWHGDVFIVRFSEDAKAFAYDVHDAPLAIFSHCSLQTIFQNMWEQHYLESVSEQDRYSGAQSEKLEADKAIILERMTPMEKSILSRLPPSTLEYLATTGCDDGALEDSRIEHDPRDPTVVRISVRTKETALDSMGWEGFCSSQLTNVAQSPSKAKRS